MRHLTSMSDCHSGTYVTFTPKVHLNAYVKASYPFVVLLSISRKFVDPDFHIA